MCLFHIASEYRDRDKLEISRVPVAEPLICNALRSALLELMILFSFTVELPVSSRLRVLHKNYFLFLSS